LVLLKPQFTDCVGGNDRSNVLFADRKGDLGEQSTVLDVSDPPDELMQQKAIGNAMMTATGPNTLELALIDPLFQRGATDS